MGVSFEVSGVIPASPERVYAAWLDSVEHTAMTGYETEISDEAVAPFNAGDGYIAGVNLELEPGKRILQRWRTTDFAEEDADSMLEITFEGAEGGTLMTIRQWDLPEDGMQYKQGWVDWYIRPMQTYFSP